MLVKDVMTTTPFGVSVRASVWDAITLMLDRSVSGLPVLNEDGAIVGVLSEGDLLRRGELGTTRHEGGWFREIFHPSSLAEAYKRSHARTVADVMTADPITVAPSVPLEQAVSLMEKHRVKRLPVVDGGRLVGILSRSDFLRVLAPPMLAATYEEPATDDAGIERTIRQELDRQPWAENMLIRATAKNGNVTLTGTIMSQAQREAARVLVENINGVRSVIDHLVWADPMMGFAV